MRRREVIAGLAAMAAGGLPRGAHAQQRGAASPAVLLLLAQVPPVETFVGIRQHLGKLGYEDGRNIVIDERVGGLPELPAALAERKVDAIFAVSPAAIRAAWESPNAIPIVAYDYETDPLRSGYVRSFARPGGKLTGAFLDQPEVGGKWLQLLKEVTPGLDHVGVVWDVDTGPSQLEAVKQAADKLGVRLDVFQLRPDLDGLFREMKQPGAKGLILLSSPLITEQAYRLADLARTARLPSISLFSNFTRRGGLLSYGPSGDEMRQRAAAMIDKIFKGERPGDIPIERPTKFDLGINLKTAAALGLSIPLWMLQQADEVIE